MENMIPKPPIPETDDPALLHEALLTAWEPDRNWSGTVTVESLPEIAALIRSLFEDNLFSIASAMYADSKNAYVRCSVDCAFESEWTDGSPEQVRVFDDYIGFSTADALWSIRPGNYIVFEDGSMRVELRAPAGHLHKHLFKKQEQRKWKHLKRRQERLKLSRSASARPSISGAMKTSGLS